MKHTVLFLLILSILLLSCRPGVYTPKPRGYFQTDFPEKAYQLFDSANYPFTFEYPVYGQITKDTNLSQEEDQPYWINVDFQEMNATLFLSFKRVSAAEPLEKLIGESYRLSYAHDVKADYIKSPEFETSNGLRGVVYAVGGNAASAYQFYATDQEKNFMRGALYFNLSPNIDSLRPAIDFLKKDMDRLIETLRFK
jgi:gliding motility-associated lipoprotein GldD